MTNQKWTFETVLSDGTYLQSTQHFATTTEALQGLSDWLAICADNGFFPTARLQMLTETEITK